MLDSRINGCQHGGLFVEGGAVADVEGCSLEGSEAGPGVHMDGARTEVSEVEGEFI